MRLRLRQVPRKLASAALRWMTGTTTAQWAQEHAGRALSWLTLLRVQRQSVPSALLAAGTLYRMYCTRN